jgi:hypothetical protein
MISLMIIIQGSESSVNSDFDAEVGYDIGNAGRSEFVLGL